MDELYAFLFADFCSLVYKNLFFLLIFLHALRRSRLKELRELGRFASSMNEWYDMITKEARSRRRLRVTGYILLYIRPNPRSAPMWSLLLWYCVSWLSFSLYIVMSFRIVLVLPNPVGQVVSFC